MINYSSVIVVVLMALVVFSVLILENNRISKQKKRLFIATNILIALGAVAECAGLHLGGKENVPHWVLAAVKAADYTFTPMSGGALIALMQQKKSRNRMVFGLLACNTLFQIIAAFRGGMIVIDAQNHYVHGPLYPIYVGVYSVIILVVAVQMVSYGKSFPKQNRTALYAIIAFIFAGIAIQEILGTNCRIAYLAVTLGAIFLFIHYSEFYQLQLDEEISEQRIKISSDPLTGVSSRFAYVDAIERYGDGLPEDFAVFLLDINGLKVVNDTQGHEAGDELIRGAAQCIAATVGKDGETFRVGGDEFVVFASMNRAQASAALDGLAQMCAAWTGEKVETLSISAGYALAKDYPGVGIEELVKEADTMMYKQKKSYYLVSGRDRRNR